jgi:nucleoid-associated protein YgaU
MKYLRPQDHKTTGLFKVMLSCCLAVMYLLAIITPAAAISAGYTDDPLKISIGARAMGMGGALAAVSDGAGNIFNNPAGIAGRETQLTSMYTSLLGDVNYSVAGGSWPVGLFGRQGNMGVGFAGATLNGFVDPDPLGFRYFDYRNNVWLLAYGEKLSFFGQNSQAGLRLKYFDEGFSGSQTDSGRGYNLDAGLIVTPWERTDLGLMAQNIILSSLGGKITWASGGEESAPKSVKLGIASRKWRPDVLLAADIDAAINRAYPARLHGGIEWQVAPVFALRGGVDQVPDAGGVSTGVTFGAGLNIREFVFDYAYHPYFSFNDATTHYFSLSYVGREGRPPATPKPRAEQVVVAPPLVLTPEVVVVAPVPPEETLGGQKLIMVKKRIFHYISKGENFSYVSNRYYGVPDLYPELAKYNNIKIKGKDQFPRGVKYIYIAPTSELLKLRGIKEKPAPLARPAPISSEKTIFHYPSSGDTITKISIKYYGTDKYAEQLGNINNVVDVKARLSGMPVKVPPISELVPLIVAPPVEPSVTPPTSPVTTTLPPVEAGEQVGPTKTIYHYTSSGDTLVKISEKYYGTADYAEQLAKLNKIKGIKKRLSGRVVTVPPLSELE